MQYNVIYRHIARFHGNFDVNKVWNITIYLISDLVPKYVMTKLNVMIYNIIRI